MRDSLSSLLGSAAGKLALSLLFASSRIILGADAIAFDSVPSPNLELSTLGRVAFAGDFDSISLYQYKGQNEKPATNHGALLSRYPNGVFATLNDTDADIKAMCPYSPNGEYKGVVFGGNFTSVGGLHTPGGIALLNTTDGSVTPLEGLNGSVSAVHCDGGRVYVGGSFTGGNSTNAIIWEDSWVDMPFAGFNGPINSITKAPNDNIIFGGEFNGLGAKSTAPKRNNSQVLPIGSATLSAQTGSGRPGLSEPKNIVCKADANTEGPGSTWLLADNSPGYWEADFGFGFTPTALRLHNTKYEGRGTKTWRYTALPDGGIMNFSYVDPNGQQRFCEARCPLPEGDTGAQDFKFVNNVGMNSFRIDISDWYGQGGGLNGIELFQNDIYTFAINDFNEPKCGGVTTGALSTPTGPWVTTPSHDSNSQYLTATLQGQNIDPEDASVVFQPDIAQAGNYSVLVYTPGCRGDNTCSTRGRVNITWTLTESHMDEGRPRSAELWQTNEFDKYDTIYMDTIDPADGFRPSVTMRPSPGQSGTLTVVAQKVRFQISNATAGGLNGIYEYDPTKKEVETDYSGSVINSAGEKLSPRERAVVSAVATEGNTLFFGGKFSGDGLNNIFSIDKGAKGPSALAGKGLNGPVKTIYANGSSVYVGGNFTNTHDNGTPGLNGVAQLKDGKWQPLGAGVDGVVMSIVPFTMNITADSRESVLGLTGFFNRVNGFGDNETFAAEKFAVWVPAKNNWLHNLDAGGISMRGTLMAYSDVPGSDPIFAGSMSSQSLGANGVASLNTHEPMALETFPAVIRAQQQVALQKRDLDSSRNSSTTGVMTGTIYKENGMFKTVLAGHFAATGTDGQNITNLLIIDGKDKDRITGLGEEISPDSTFQSLAVLDKILYAGGNVSGNVNGKVVAGIVTYDLSKDALTGGQPAALQGDDGVIVNAIAPRPKAKEVFVGGSFEAAGAISCSTLCIWDAGRNQWVSPGGDLSGNISSLIWVSDSKLLLAGDITSGKNKSTIFTFDSSKNQFEEFPGANKLPGPVTALTPASKKGDNLWASGKTADGSAYLQRFDGEKWLSVDDKFQPGTNIRSIQVLMLSDKGKHEKTDLIDRGQDLLILGQVNVTDFGTASAVLFNGTDMIPFLLSTSADNKPGSLSQVFVENPQKFFNSGDKRLALGFIVLIALAIALALTFLLVVAGILLEWYRKKAKGYTPAPSGYPDRTIDTQRIPPEHLFGTLSTNRPPAI